jgi:hypothetical protein
MQLLDDVARMQHLQQTQQHPQFLKDAELMGPPMALGQMPLEAGEEEAEEEDPEERKESEPKKRGRKSAK